MADIHVSGDGATKIKNWLGAQQFVERAKSRLNSDECALRNAETDLARWMLPEDAQMGEKICVWFGDSLVQVECTSRVPLDGKVTFRTRGRKLYEFAA